MSENAETVSQAVEPATWPTLPSRLEIAERCAAIADRVDELEREAEQHLVIENEKQAEDALLYIDAVAAAEKSIETRRKKYVEEPNAFVKTLNGIVKGYTGRFEEARKKVTRVFQAYKDKVEAEKQRIATEKRKKEEAEAIERAQRLQDQGKTKAADQMLEIAATAPKKTVIERVGSGTGISAYDVITWRGEVADMRTFLAHLLAGTYGELSFDDISVSQSALNRFAGNHKRPDEDKTERVVVTGIAVVRVATLGRRS